MMEVRPVTRGLKGNLMRRVLLAVGFGVALVGCSGEKSPDKQKPEPVDLKPFEESGTPAPEVNGEDSAGNKISLSGYKGKVVLLDFWATWCPPCVALIPHEKKLVAEMKGRPFALLGVSADNAPADLRDFEKTEALPWPSLFDGRGGKIAQDWKIDAFPTMVLIDHQGKVRYRIVGGGRDAERTLDAAVHKLVEEAEKK
jgi:thiol-disulfide isomerase/thioredoxin